MDSSIKQIIEIFYNNTNLPIDIIKLITNYIKCNLCNNSTQFCCIYCNMCYCSRNSLEYYGSYCICPYCTGLNTQIN